MTPRTIRRTLAAAALAVAAAAPLVSATSGGTVLTGQICHFREIGAGGVFYCVPQTPLSQGGCEVNLGTCDGGCDVNVGNCTSDGSCLVNLGTCGDGSLITL